MTNQRTTLSPRERRALTDAARGVPERNRRRGVSVWGGRLYDFVCPSPSHYPFQWLWDSCFHAIALCHVDPARAQQELRGVLAAAQPDGFVPHMTLWEREGHEAALADYNIRYGGQYWTATTQPPVLATAIERVYAVTRDAGFLQEVLPAARAFYDWLARERDPDRDGLISILQPDESGLDACPKYDSLLQMPSLDPPGLRRAMERLFAAYTPFTSDRERLGLGLFDVEDVLVNVVCAQGLAALARLLPLAGGTVDESAALTARSDRVLAALIDYSWDEQAGAFWDLAGREHRPLRVLTFTSLMPLVLPGLPRPVAETLVERHLTNPREFWLPFPVASVAATEPSFDPRNSTRLIWRGTTWVNANWFLVHGLRAHGYDAVASELTERTLAMVARGGVYEHFSPITAAGYGAASFGWTTLVLDLMVLS